MTTDRQKKKIFKLIDNFCKRECFSVNVYETSAFCYGGEHYVDEFIGIAFDEPMDSTGIAVISNGYSRGLPMDIDLFTFSLFHEIGHSQTDAWWSEKELNNYSKEVAKCDGRTYEGNQRYFNIPQEKVATDWAIEYIIANKRKVKILMNKINKILSEEG